jgi:hypothetical protein
MEIFRAYGDDELPSNNGFKYGDDGHGVSAETHKRQGIKTATIDRKMARLDDPRVNERFSGMVLHTWTQVEEMTIEGLIRDACEPVDPDGPMPA